MSTRYKKSQEFINRAEYVIPLGSQTFSKSRTQYPVGISPLFASRGKGAYLWDIDGNKYLDLVNNLASITLGYAYKPLDRIVKKQLGEGVGFSLPGKLETYVAEKIVELVPSAEQVRFAKNGTDATSAAVRLARAYTSRDLVVVCGYHGWQDWYISTTSRNKGIPQAISSLTLKFEYNNIKSLEDIFSQNTDKIACVILEPMNSIHPKEGFLRQVIELCEKNGAICVFDETITGFRFSNGGAQKLFDVKPHLSTFGKGIANGYPLSVVCGNSAIMKEMNQIFFSGTFGGELLSLAAANTVLDMHINDAISPELIKNGNYLNHSIESAINNSGMEEFLKLTGHPTWTFVNWNQQTSYPPEVLKTFFLQEALKRGLLVLSTHNISLAHKKRTADKISNIYFEVLKSMKELIESGQLREKLEVDPIIPLFRIR
jgi:glutamate-1-semialdehyde 2,1-aminomutase